LDADEEIIKQVRQAIAQAMHLYDALAEVLAEQVRALQAAEGSGRVLSEDERACIRDHQKIIMMVLDFESQIFKRRPTVAAGAGESLDLGAARGEVRRRLARLEAVETARPDP
jgi:shikimate kinase